jgi:uncharacterized membrane protein
MVILGVDALIASPHLGWYIYMELEGCVEVSWFLLGWILLVGAGLEWNPGVRKYRRLWETWNKLSVYFDRSVYRQLFRQWRVVSIG